MQPSRFGSILAAAVLALAGCGDKNCKHACDKLNGCNLGSSGFSCDSSCGPPDDKCAVCVNEKSCAEITARQCGGNGVGDCANASFTPK
jgi:hypothetical protein